MSQHTTMRAAVWHAAGDVRVQDVPIPPEPGPGEVTVAVDVATICASDLAEYRDGPHVIPVDRPHRLTGRTAPLTLGHEFVGRVTRIGPSITNLAVGDRVCGDACLRCGTCFWCRRGDYHLCEIGGSIGLHADGAFAEYLSAPDYTLHRVPESVTDTAAAVVEPLSVGLHALQRGRFDIGESVVVVGFGMIGAAVTMLAVAGGAGRVIVVEASTTRAEAARAAGAADVLTPGDTLRARVRALTGNRGADLVLDCTGRADVLPVAVELSRRGGRIVVCGIAHEASAIRADRLVYFERELLGSLGYRHNHEAVLQLVDTGRLDVSWLFAPAITLEDIVPLGLKAMTATGAAWLRIPVEIGGV